MHSVNEQLRTLLNSGETSTNRRKILNLIEAFLVPTSPEFSEVIEQETFHEFLGYLEKHESSRLRCWSGIYIIRFLQHCDIAHAHLFEASEDTRFAIGQIIITAQNEDLKSIAGTIIALACSKGASPADFFTSGSPTPLTETFPRAETSCWSTCFRDYLMEHGNCDRVQESDSTALLASSIFIENAPLGNDSVPTIVELLPDLLTFTQVWPSGDPVVTEINLCCISRAQFQSSELPGRRSSASQGRVPHVVLKLKPEAGNYILNSEEKYADEIRLVAEPSYDVKGFIAALLELISEEMDPDADSKNITKGKSLSKGDRKDPTRVESKAAVATASLETGPRSPEAVSATEIKGMQTRQSLKNQMRDEQGEMNTLPISKPTNQSRPNKRPKLKSSNHRVDTAGETGRSTDNRVEQAKVPVDEPFAIPSSPENKSDLKSSKSRATSSSKTQPRKQSTEKAVKSKPKKSGKAASAQLQLVTGPISSKDADILSAPDEAKDLDCQGNHGTYEGMNDISRNTVADNEERSGVDIQYYAKEALELPRKTSPLDEAGLMLNEDEPRSERDSAAVHINSPTGLGLDDQETEPENQDDNDGPNTAAQRLADWSIRKPPVTLFGPKGPTNQGTILTRQHELSDQHQIHDQAAIAQVTADLEVPDERYDTFEDQEPAFASEGSMLPAGECPGQGSMVPAGQFPSNADDLSAPGHSTNVEEQLHFEDTATESHPLGNTYETQAAEETVSEIQSSPPKLRSPGQNIFDAQNHRVHQAIDKRPLMEDEVSEKLAPKRVKKVDFDEQLKIDKSALRQLNDPRKSAQATKSVGAGTHLSRRVDTNGSPYPKRVCLPIDRKPGESSLKFPSSAVSGLSEIEIPSHKGFRTTPLKFGPRFVFQGSSVLWCDKFPAHIQPGQVEKLFRNNGGDVEWSWIVRRDAKNELSAHCGYVKMCTVEAAKLAVHMLNGQSINGLPVIVQQVNQTVTFGPIGSSNDILGSNAKQLIYTTEHELPSSPTLGPPSSTSCEGQGEIKVHQGKFKFGEESSSQYYSSESPCDGRRRTSTFELRKAFQFDQQCASNDKALVCSDGIHMESDRSPGIRPSIPVAQRKFAQPQQLFASPVGSDSPDLSSSPMEDIWDDSEETLTENSRDDDLTSLGSLSSNRVFMATGLARDNSSEERSVTDSSDSSYSSMSSGVSDPSEASDEVVNMDHDVTELKPHQELYVEALIGISQGLLSRVMEQETAIKDLASKYRQRGLNAAEKFRDACFDDVKRADDELEATRRSVSLQLEYLSRDLDPSYSK